MSGFISNTPARQSLAARFGLPYHDGMQDWEYEVADAVRFPEFLQAYRHPSLSDSERESLMEMLVQCVEDRLGAVPEQPPESLPEWQSVAGLLRQRASLHAATIDYWSCLEEPDLSLCFAVSAPMRSLRAGLQPQAS